MQPTVEETQFYSLELGLKKSFSDIDLKTFYTATATATATLTLNLNDSHLLPFCAAAASFHSRDEERLLSQQPVSVSPCLSVRGSTQENLVPSYTTISPTHSLARVHVCVLYTDLTKFMGGTFDVWNL